jgi:regulation of enolase protein 1 (concanavalin A-like superfamily)
MAICASLQAATMPDPWVDVDLGGPTYPGSITTNANGSFTIVGNGTDIWNPSDQCNYYYTWASGSSWTAQVKVDAEIEGGTNLSGWAKCELMVRASSATLGPQAPDAYISMMFTDNTNGGVGWLCDQFRSKAGGQADWIAPTQPSYTLPVWLKLARNGSVFSCESSEDGKTWTDYIDLDTAGTNQVGQDNKTTFGVPFPDIVTVGIACTDGNDGQVDTNYVSNIKFTFPNITLATRMAALVQNRNWTNYAGCEACFSFAATNNTTPYYPYLMGNSYSYQWYKNGTAMPGATGTDFTWLIDPSDASENGAKVFCAVDLVPPWNGGDTATFYSTTNTLTVLLPTAYYTNGLKLEYWANAVLGQVESNNIGPATWIGYQQSFDNDGFESDGGFGTNYASRNSGWFIPPTNGNYVFFVASDGNSDLFLSTDASMANKTMIAQEPGWSSFDNWLTPGDAGTTSAAQKRSDQWTANASGYNPPWASGIPLLGGHPYYIELDHEFESITNLGQADDMSVTYQTIEEVSSAGWTNVFNGTPTIIAGTNHNIMLATWPATQASFRWTQQPPTNPSVDQAASAIFTAQAVSGGEFTPTYQWYRRGQPIAGATETVYDLPVTIPGDTSAQFYVVASEEGLKSMTSYVTLTVTTANTIWEPGFARVEWWFTNNIEELDNLPSLEDGALGPPQLTVAAPQVGALIFGGNDTAPPYSYDDGRITCWFVPPKNGAYTFYCCSDDAADLFLSTDATPANKRMIAQELNWSAPEEWLTYGESANTNAQKCSDTFVVPGSATNTPPLNPNGITLVKGQKYYLELDHLNYGGGDDCVADVTPTGSPPAEYTPTTLTGSYIGYYFPRCAFVAFTNQPVSVSNAAPFTMVTFTANGITDSQIGIMGADYPESGLTNFVLFQWTVNGTAVPGANGSSFTLAAEPSLNNAPIVCQMRALGYANAAGTPIWSNSTTAFLTVATNSVTPAATYASIFQQNGQDNTVLDIRFNKPMNPASLLSATYTLGTYTVANGQLGAPNVFTNGSQNLSPTSEALSSDQYASVQLQLVGPLPTFPQTATVSATVDAWGNACPAASLNVAAEAQLADTDIGNGTNDPAVHGLLWMNGPNSYTIQCEGSEIWGVYDGFNFAYQQVNGDFDVVVQVKDATHTDNWAQAGLMVRETLDPSSREWCILCNPDSSDGIAAPDGSGDGASTISTSCRNTTGVATDAGWATGDYSEPPQYPNAWVRLKMTAGQNLSCYYSIDGVRWALCATDNPSTSPKGQSNALTTPFYIGICQTADVNDAYPPPAWTALTYLDTVDYANYNSSFVEAPAAPPVPALVTGTPAIAFASYYTNNNLPAGPAQMVDLKFNKPMDPGALLSATYDVPGLTVTAVNVYTNESINLSPTSEAVSNNYSSVLLTVTGTPKLPLAITVNDAKDYWGNALASPGNAASANLCALINQDIGVPPLGTDPVVPSVMWVNGPNSYTIQCEGSDIWNNDDGFNFSYTEVTGDFDVVVRTLDTTHTSNWSKAGLMVREDLTAGSRDWNIVNDPDSSDGIMALDGSGTGASLIECNCRNATNGGSGGWQVETNNTAAAYPNAWVRLQRTGTSLAAYYGTNGTDWVQAAWDDPTTVGAKTALPATVYVGLCQTAHNNDSTPTPPFNELVFLDTADYDSFNAAYVPPATGGKLSITRSGSTFILSWAPAGGTLQSSPALGASANWQPVANATNPMTNSIGKTDQYFRLQY